MVNRRVIRFVELLLGMMAFTPLAVASDYDDCLLMELKASAKTATVAEIEESCREGLSSGLNKTFGSAVQKRLKAERNTRNDTWAITPHRPNYLLPVTYNTNVNRKPFSGLSTDENDWNNLKGTEAEFQISLKFPLAYDILDYPIDLYATFTSQSWWQVYSGDISAPFRETNYEPELIAAFHPADWRLGGFNIDLFSFGLNHESNGRAEPLSRSWNRLYASALLSKGNFALKLTPWWRIPEDEIDDDNPNIERYMGYGEVLAGYMVDDHVFSAMFRNNLRSENKTNLELTWSHPVLSKLRFYAQWYYGYGESLIDYDHRVNRIGIGVALTDYLGASDNRISSPLVEQF